MEDKEKVFGRLLELIDRLRGDGGCPWDRAQTLETLQPYLIDETHEILAAINSLDGENLAEELGDLLFHVLMVCRAAEAERSISLEKIAGAIEEKMIRRHPHVFAGTEVDGVSGVLENWEKIKAREKKKARPESILADPLRDLPALRRAQRIQAKTSRIGFDWDNPAAVLPKIREELEEVAAELAAGDQRRLEEEIGDLLFSTVNLARLLDLDAELGLQRMINRWIRRFRKLEEQAEGEGRSLKGMSLEEMDRVWDRVKRG
ncbi:MAG: nucleoside triphosphate pyrophosphohydrolase [Candidatus Erginobacter occultus]|nr:nucleoside triphosphate pyrophosphohydrolase [Candidatus Erginobacter occultus]